MENTENKIDHLPDEFASEEEAGEFWDTHSISDYKDFLEPVEMNLDFKMRNFEIEIDEASFFALRASAIKYNKPIKQLASEILKEKLEAA